MNGFKSNPKHSKNGLLEAFYISKNAVDNNFIKNEDAIVETPKPPIMLRISCLINFWKKMIRHSRVMHKHVNLLTILVVRLSKFIVTKSYQYSNTLDSDINVVQYSCAFEFRKFKPVSLAGLKSIIESTASKT